MKKLIAILLCALMLVATAACTGNAGKPVENIETAPGQSVENEPDAQPDEPDGVKVGGWQPAEDPALTDALRTIFDKALEGTLGVDYTPVALLSTQIVAGINYCFLAQGTVVYPDAQPGFKLVYVYADLSGNVHLLDIADMPIVASGDGTLSVPAEPGTLMGGWAYESDPTITDEMKTRLDKALEGLVGAEYEPIANLGVQVVAGLNRCVLCKVTPVVPDAVPHYALVYVYEDLEGGASLNEVVDLDLDMPEAEPDNEPIELPEMPNAEAETQQPAEPDNEPIELPEMPNAEAETQQPAEPDNEPIELPEMPNAEESVGAVAGGWQVSYAPEMTDAFTAIFEKALNGLVGVDYVPVACLGTQIVAGTNYCFLAKATVVYPNAQPSYVLVYVYEDLSGNARILNFADMPVVPDEYGSAEPITSEETLAGGWFYTESYEITPEIKAKFGEALNSYGYLAVYEPVANLAEQIVAGTNRCILVRFTERIPEALPQYKLMYVYEPLVGAPEITGTVDFDIAEFCTYGA